MSTIEIGEPDSERADLIFSTWRNDREPPATTGQHPSHAPSPHSGKVRLVGVHPDLLPILELHGIWYQRVD